ncbi:FAD-dependent oxidoreductase [Allosphingosinicella sp.]|uniref:FAD-dependent oxidoreductase n=1 Tax=Allosphingosinicella sp. TaxID=2823234 RepID=UPI002FC1BFB4
MNVGDERSISYWMETAPAIDAPPLPSNASCDVIVIGSGIAGLSTAYELSRFGRSVIVIDRGAVGRGMTARTTAHLSTELDDFYSELIRVRGEDEARLFHDSQVAAVNRVETICRDEGIDADFARVDGFLFPAEEKHRADLEEEYRACRSLGIDVEWDDCAPIPGLDTGRALRFPDQGRFHPTRYLAGLARAIEASGGRLHGDTAYISHRETGEGVEIMTESGPVIRAGAAVFATNSPVNDRVAIHSKQVPSRTYAIAGRVAKGSVPDALVWDTHEAYHYVRLQPLDDTEDLLIVGGEDHRSGELNDMGERFGRLEQWTRERYPDFGSTQYRWSGQVMEPIDFMPFSGRNHGSSNIYVHTGDSGMGITNGVAGSLTILPLIIGEDSRYAPLFDPGRKAASIPAATEFVKGQAGAVRNFSEYLRPGDVKSADDLAPGEGAVVREGMRKIAACKSEDGTIVRRSAVCTHLGCLVHWNSFEKCWDCPCHGSQFAPDGEVLNGPAVTALGSAD